MLRNFDANIRGANPNVDVLVFSINNTAAEHEAECVLPNVYYMALLEHWGPRRQGSATATHLWSFAWADAGYRCASGLIRAASQLPVIVLCACLLQICSRKHTTYQSLGR
jgi:hypothetical protein